MKRIFYLLLFLFLASNLFAHARFFKKIPANKNNIQTYKPGFGGTPNILIITLLKQIYGYGYTNVDGCVAVFDPSYSKGLGPEDSKKLANGGENLTFWDNVEDLSIDGLPYLSAGDTIKFGLYNMVKDSLYVLKFDATQFINVNNVQGYIVDGFLHTYTPLSTTTNSINFTTTTNTASYGHRFYIAFKSQKDTTVCGSYTWSGSGNTYNSSGTYFSTDGLSALNLTVNQPSSSVTDTSVCSATLPFTWNNSTITGAGPQIVHLTNKANCDSAATLNVKLKIETSSTTDTAVCLVALPFDWNGLSITGSGSQLVHLTNKAGCDSAATINVTIKANSSSVTDTAVCMASLPFNWNGLSITGGGSHTVHINNHAGCDSAATINVKINSTSSSVTDTSVCMTTLPFTWNGLTITGNGSKTAHIPNYVGCDSAAKINVTVKVATSSITDTAVCFATLPFTWNGLTITGAGSKTAHIPNYTGCDSAAKINVTVKVATSSTTDTAICQTSLPFNWNGLTITGAGSQTAHILNYAGCDSAATIQVIINATSSSITDTAICLSVLPFNWNGLTISSSGSQTAHIPNYLGCDSAATINVTTLATSNSITDTTVCKAILPFSWNGLTISSGGSMTAHLPNYVGCDSVATINVKVNNASSSVTDTTVCMSLLPFNWNGLTINAAGSQTAHIPNIAGCDSAATINVKVNNASSSITDTAVCTIGLPFNWNGIVINASGSRTVFLNNKAGCDSATTINVTVNTASSSVTNTSVCLSGLPFNWNGLSITGAGSQTVHLTNYAGCDSAATINVTINSVSSSVTDTTVCLATFPFNWNGITITGAGTKIVHLVNFGGCDSAATIHVKTKNASSSITDSTICTTALPLSWNGLTITGAGSNTAHLANHVGCDSAATINIKLKQPSLATFKQVFYTNYTWHGTTYSTGGTYTFDTLNIAGCDSLMTLQLTYSPIVPTYNTINIDGCGFATFNGINYHSSVTIHDTLKSIGGYDSVYRQANIIIHNISVARNIKYISSCKPVVYDGNSYIGSVIIVDTIKNIFGCDSIYNMNYITVNPITPIVNTTIANSCDSIIFKSVVYYKDTTLIVDTIQSAGGCDSVYNALQLNIYSKPSGTAIIPSKTCVREFISFNYTGNGTTYNWSFGDGSFSNLINPTHAYADTGLYYVNLKALNAGGCISDTVQTVYVQPAPALSIGKDTTIFTGTSLPLTVNSSDVITSIKWSPDRYLNNDTSLSVICKPLAEVNYTAEVTGLNGCKAFDTIHIKTFSLPVFPNSISPNGDGIHDKWELSNLSFYKNISVKVFDREGNNVYENKHYDNSWKGTYNGNLLPVGTYYYYVVVNNTYQLTGWVFIVR